MKIYPNEICNANTSGKADLEEEKVVLLAKLSDRVVEILAFP